MPDDRFTQTTLHAPRADQSEAIATYKSGAHLLNYAYSGRHSGVATIDALLPEQDGFSVWNTTAAGTIIPFSFMDASLRYFDMASYANASDPTTRGVYESDILELSEDQKNAIRMGLSEWARYIDVEFVEVAEGNDEVGLLRFGGTNYTSASGYAWAYYPNWYYAAGGDTWFSPNMMRESNWLPGTYEYLTVIHEIGHALSLAHAHDGHEMPDAQDDIRYTIMSYNNHDSQITHWMDGKLVHHGAYTPMAYDIQTAQYLYGANATTEIEATTYTFDQSVPRVQALYDTGGIDAIDLSNFTLRNVVDLTPGASSTLGYTHHIDDNTAIAFGTTIENVFAGSGSDDVFGNDANNEIHAGAGDDLIAGGAGNDTLLGQSDHDTISGGTGHDHVLGGDGHDHLSDTWGNDILNGGEGGDILIAHLGENTLSGGADNDVICAGLGDDNLDGGSGDDLLIADYPHRYARGNDTLIGGDGNDKLDGGQGADEFVFFIDDTGNDTIAQFDTDGTLIGAGFDVGQDQIHLISDTGAAQDYALHYTDQGAVLTWGTSQILIYGMAEDSLGIFDILVGDTWA